MNCKEWAQLDRKTQLKQFAAYIAKIAAKRANA